MQQLPTVYAYRDDNPIIEVPTRWQPRKVYCTKAHDHTDEPGIRYAVKFRRETPASAAACISEVVSYALLRYLGIRTFAAALVEVSSDLAFAYRQADNMDFTVESGAHFGTVFDVNMIPGPPDAWNDMIDPNELVAMWVADSWLMNIDREQYGNICLVHGVGGRVHLMAADQSDCFLGSGRLADGSCFDECQNHGAAPYSGLFAFVERSIGELGCNRLYRILTKIQRAAHKSTISASPIEQSIQLVPGKWWRQAGVNSSDVVECLTRRANNMRRIVDVDRLEGIHRVFQQHLGNI